jgi:ABC-type amino acid transport substrate-binding protein
MIGVNVPYAPNEFKDTSGQIVGFDVDLMNAVARTLGLVADYRETGFEAIIPSIRAGDFNVGMSSFTDTKDREGSADFVTYFEAGTLWAQKAGAGVDPNNACGLRIGVQYATIQETEELPAKTQACTEAANAAIVKVVCVSQDDLNAALLNGGSRCDVGGFAGDGVCGQDVRRSPGARGRDLRYRAVQLAGGQGLGAGGVATSGAGTPDADR